MSCENTQGCEKDRLNFGSAVKIAAGRPSMCDTGVRDHFQLSDQSWLWVFLPTKSRLGYVG